MATPKPLVLVTGGSGYIALHCINQLLNSSYRVRTTVRNPSRTATVTKALTTAGAPNVNSLDFVNADLLHDNGWPEAVKDCTYVLHVASPFPATVPKHEDELIKPARDGTLRVLKAARDAGVKRVIVTSSFAAIGYGQPSEGKIFTEMDWTNLDDPTVPAYQRSKTIAERAAWEFMEREGGSMEMATVNPVGVFGPMLTPDQGTTVVFIKKMLNGEVPALPRLALGVVDVRDVADLHLRAMTDEKAAGQRFLAISGRPMWAVEFAKTIKERMGNRGRKVWLWELPDFMVRLLSYVLPEAALVVSELGKEKVGSSEKAEKVLGWRPRKPEESIVATCESLIELGVVKV